MEALFHWCIIYSPKHRLRVHATPAKLREPCPNLPDRCAVIDTDTHYGLHVFLERLISAPIVRYSKMEAQVR